MSGAFFGVHIQGQLWQSALVAVTAAVTAAVTDTNTGNTIHTQIAV